MITRQSGLRRNKSAARESTEKGRAADEESAAGRPTEFFFNRVFALLEEE